MSIKEEIRKALSYLTENSIQYVVIRNHPNTIYEIDGDIDLLLKSSQVEKTNELFYELGYVKVNKPEYNTGFFYSKLTCKGLIKFHIQFELFCFGSGKLHVFEGFSQKAFSNFYYYDRIKFVNDSLNKYCYLAKVLYENKQINGKYSNFLKAYYKKFDYDDFKRDLHLFLDKNNIIHIYKKTGCINMLIKLVDNIKILYSNLRLYNSVCIVGIDGTGKSTAVKNLKKLLGKKSITQYMGQKNWELKIVKKYMIKKDTNPNQITRIKGVYFLALYFDMCYRILRNTLTRKVKIYDRFVDEYYVKSSGFKRSLLRLPYLVFPTPKHFFYLTCDLNTSVARKDDIQSPEDIIKLKRYKIKFDDYYFSKSHIIVINTDRKNAQDVLEKIVWELSKRDFEKYL